MTKKRLIPIALAGALLSPVFSLGLGASVVDAATCPANRRSISRLTLPAHGGFYSSKTFAVRTYSGPGTPDLLHYGLGRDIGSAAPGAAGNMLIGGHSSTRLFYGKNNFEYHMKFLKAYPKPSSSASLARRRAWTARQQAWLRARGLTMAPHARKNPAPFAHLLSLRAGQVVKVRVGCWVYNYAVLGGAHETINANQASYALRRPTGTRATSIFTANASRLRTAGVTSASALSNSSKLLTMYGCVKVGLDPAAKRKIVRAVYTGKTWTTAS